MIDYKKIGFKCGLELHQELSGRKLFCECSTENKEEKLMLEFKRKLRAVAGESGEIDVAAAYEQLRNRIFIYHGYEGEFCLVDMDSEPPHRVNKDALETALALALLLKMDIPDAIQVMRKTVADGSACSGFQRTMVVGLGSKDSFIETSRGVVRLSQLNLEEDACKIEKREGNKVYYSLSRQGIPLLELGTEADIKDPLHAKEVAEKIGMIFRSFPSVKRGIGTIRQDINISIKGGPRIEIKGWQDLRTLHKLIENETLRHVNLLKIRDELKNVRKLKRIETEIKEVTYVFKNTKSAVISKIVNKGGKVFAAVARGFSGLAKKELCPGKTFGKELAEYAMAYGANGIIHSDENLEKYKLVEEFKNLEKIFNAAEEDLIFIVAEKEFIAKNAINAVVKRIKYSLNGIPEETRVPDHQNIYTRYARPLPGANRLYPETDVELIIITDKILKKIRIPELISEKAIRFEKEYGLSPEYSLQVAKEDSQFDIECSKRN